MNKDEQLEGLESEFCHEHSLYCESCNAEGGYGNDDYVEQAYKDGWRIAKPKFGEYKSEFRLMCAACYGLRNDKEFWT